MAGSIWDRLSISAQSADKLNADERVRNWEEVYQGFDLQRARLEAARCIHCPSAPCMEACPVHNDIPTAMLKLEQGDPIGAAQVFRQTSNLPEMCGRLCPQERLCEGDCPVGFAIRPDGRKDAPVRIGLVEAFVADAHREHVGGFPLPAEIAEESGRRVAIVGSGPSGLTVAEELVKRGHACTVFDQWPVPGGALAHGIPNFKLGRQILQQKIQFLTMLGVDFVPNLTVGRDVTIDELFDDGFDAVYLGTGPGVDREPNVPGTSGVEGVVTATDFLRRANASAVALLAEPGFEHAPAAGALTHRPGGPRVVVVGGGDAALDVVRAALRLGASSVVLAFEGTQHELHARAEEVEDARAEGVQFRFGCEPVQFLANRLDKLVGVRLQRVERHLSQPHTNGANGRARRARLAPRVRTFRVPGTEFEVPADIAVLALGYVPDPLVKEALEGAQETDEGFLHADQGTGRTSIPGVFAGGDVVRGTGLVVTAMAAGRRIAEAIDAYLTSPEVDERKLRALPEAPTSAQVPRRRIFGFGR